VHGGMVYFMVVRGGLPGNAPAPSNHGSARDPRQATVVRS
jgi:hypothetical protein